RRVPCPTRAELINPPSTTPTALARGAVLAVRPLHVGISLTGCCDFGRDALAVASDREERSVQLLGSLTEASALTISAGPAPASGTPGRPIGPRRWAGPRLLERAGLGGGRCTFLRQKR